MATLNHQHCLPKTCTHLQHIRTNEKVQQITNSNPGDASDQPDCVQVRAEAGGSQRRGHDRDVPEVQLGEQGGVAMIMLMMSCQRLMGTWLTVEREKLSEDSNALKITVLRKTDDTSVYDESIESKCYESKY